MSEPFLGEIKPVGFNFAPHGHAMCQGQVLPISQNTALFSLLGTNFGGNGTSNFALPDLRGRIPLSSGQGPGLSSYQLGEVGGVASVSLTAPQLPSHTHNVVGSSAASTSLSPSGTFPGPAARKVYTPASTGQFAVDAVIPTGGGQPHENMQPFLSINYIIAMVGIFPARP